MNTPIPLPLLPDVQWPVITHVTVVRIRRALRHTFRTALREVSELNAWQLTVHTAQGQLGSGTTVATPQITGDTDSSIASALRDHLVPLVVGSTSLLDSLRAVAEAPVGPSPRAAMDLALHDLAARACSVDLANLLGGTEHPVGTDVTISLDAPATMAKHARARVVEGFEVVKLKLGDSDTDLARVQAVWDAVGGPDVRIRLDANQAWNALTASRLLAAIHTAGIHIELVEQPVPAADLDGMAAVTADSPFPILADESAFTGTDVHRIAEHAAANLINLKLLKTGGIWPAREVVTACAQTGLGLLVGCMLEPAEGVAAARAVACVATEGDTAHDLDAAWWAGAEPA